ncbi:YceI family protein [Leclercia adecarboxylata]|uniref:YceI family protein n=1 Tax=Leclercia adecarboxylata TaxID=83655 RepID=UPI002DB668BF|nr:YceI family protein [Leclercia adecarboxylata]MEB6380099.1 YceI family protein [Leclercia adecarboxylata]
MLRLMLLLVVTLMCPSLYAAPVVYAIDTQKTAIKLSWRAFGGILSWAHLNGVTGTVTLNPDNEFDDRIRVTVPVATLQASNNLLTWQLKSDMFFDAARYPTITFTSTRVVKLGADRYRAFGTLTVRELSRPVILDATFDPLSEETIALHATTEISRSAYKMDRFALVVDDRIAIAIAIQAMRRP